MVQVTFADGYTSSVRPLGIFELDQIDRPSGRPFTYTMQFVDGETAEVELDPDDWDDPPEKPDTPRDEIEEESADWYALRDWQRFEAARSYRNQQFHGTLQFLEDVTAYVLEQSLDAEAIPHVQTSEDWEKVYRAALVPQLTKDLLAQTLRQTYEATWNEEEIFDALEKTSGGKGTVNAIRLWENKVMLEMQMSELQYASLDLHERARKVCALMIGKWLEHLEIDNFRKERNKGD